jgi:hypothetical protein
VAGSAGRKADRSKKVNYDKLLRAEARGRAGEPASARWRRWAGWALFVVGSAFFLASNIAARAGVVLLAFDRHHIIGQFGGGAAAIFGLCVATRRRSG